jgi:hypothetical protein
VSSASASNASAIAKTLSMARLTSYLAATNSDLSDALELYGWNARLSGALMVPAHFTEVVARNAVDEVLMIEFGQSWPWARAFELSLSNPHRGYSPRRELLQVRGRIPTTGKVIAELSFAFWCHMFTSRHDVRLWDKHALSLFPGTNENSPAALRLRIHNDLEVIRRIRNRMAHHEPIHTYDVADALQRMHEIVMSRCVDTASWLNVIDDSAAMLAERPNFGARNLSAWDALLGHLHKVMGSLRALLSRNRMN